MLTTVEAEQGIHVPDGLRGHLLARVPYACAGGCYRLAAITALEELR